MNNITISGNKQTILDNELVITSTTTPGLRVLGVDTTNNTVVLNKNTTTPGLALDVEGSVAIASTLNVQNNKLVVDASGNVGINTSTPTAQLHVNGSVLVTGSLWAFGSIANVETTTFETTDPNIVLNYGGNDTSASAAGLSIERYSILSTSNNISNTPNGTQLLDLNSSTTAFAYQFTAPSSSVTSIATRALSRLADSGTLIGEIWSTVGNNLGSLLFQSANVVNVADLSPFSSNNIDYSTTTFNFTGAATNIGQKYYFVVRFLSSISTAFNALGGGLSNDQVNAIAIYQNEIYAGGWKNVGGTAIDHLAKWNGTSWVSVGNLNNRVRALIVYDNELYIGGDFTDAAGLPGANRIVKFDGTDFSLVGQPSALSNWVRCFEIHNNELYIGGQFTGSSGIGANYLVKWNGTSFDTSVGAGLTSVVNAVKYYNSQLYAGTTNTNSLQRWTGSAWSSVGGLTSFGINALEIYNNQLYIGGFYIQLTGIAGNRSLVRYDGSTLSIVDSLDTLTNTVLSLKVYNDELYLGGIFADIAGVVGTQRLARYNGSSFNRVGTAPAINEGVYVLATSNNDLYLGGQFTNALGMGANKIAKFTAGSLVRVSGPQTTNNTYGASTQSYPSWNTGSDGIDISLEIFSSQIDPADIVWDNARSNFRTGPQSNVTSLILVNGNTDGNDIAIGTIDNFDVNLKTNNINRVTISQTGDISFAGNLDISGSFLMQGIPVEYSGAPLGAIVSFLPGVFSSNNNTGFSVILGSSNTAASVNAWLLANGYDHWKVCDGTEYNVAGSPLYGGAGRFTPNLTDDRFLMGSTTAGVLGGTNDRAHTHSINQDLTSINVAHSHTLTTNTIPHSGQSFSIDNNGALNTGTSNTGSVTTYTPNMDNFSHNHYVCHFHYSGDLYGQAFADNSTMRQQIYSGGFGWTSNISLRICGVGGDGPAYCYGAFVAGCSELMSGSCYTNYNLGVNGFNHAHPTGSHAHSVCHSHCATSSHNHGTGCHGHNDAGVTWTSATVNSQFNHTHSTTSTSMVENRPQYLTCFYLARVV